MVIYDFYSASLVFGVTTDKGRSFRDLTAKSVQNAALDLHESTVGVPLYGFEKLRLFRLKANIPGSDCPPHIKHGIFPEVSIHPVDFHFYTMARFFGCLARGQRTPGQHDNKCSQ